MRVREDGARLDLNNVKRTRGIPIILNKVRPSARARAVHAEHCGSYMMLHESGILDDDDTDVPFLKQLLLEEWLREYPRPYFLKRILGRISNIERNERIANVVELLDADL